GGACGQTASALRGFTGHPLTAVILVALLMAGFTFGFVGLVGIEQKLIRSGDPLDPQNLTTMIAVGIGLHNLSEGLAIGQAYAQGQAGLTLSLIMGFALHNATEGFGIMGPMVRAGLTVSWGRILLLALIGGGPTFLGTLLGGLWTSPFLSVAALSMAGGALLYVVKELLHGARREAAQALIMTTLVLGFTVGWATEVVADMSQGGAVEADGDKIPASALGGPSISPADAAAQDEASNDLLREKAMEPKLLPDGQKEYDLTASAFTWQVFPGARTTAWGYNGQVPGPLLRFKVGDRVKIVVKNLLPQETTLHWHGLAVPNAMDGVPGITQKAIAPGGTFTYAFKVTPQMAGTHLYHTHVNDNFQMDKGLHGVLIVDPASGAPRVDVDAVYEMGSFRLAGSEEENVFTLNGKACPEAPALRVSKGSTVRLRLINASAEESHVMHLHGYTFKIVALDGNPLASPVSANTVHLAPSQTADVEFTASNPGLWMFHCHILDHLINPGPKGDGSETQLADMGGLMTFVEVVDWKKPKSGYLAAGSVSADGICR
ncbi:MAG TPA: multicopper oxidase domain-containing protein, partial [bacterium]|nr:multicopper oxidase domain-containing protein [bacterium]